MDDAELVARSRRRDADAFGVLVERHQRLVFGVALARCQDPALAEDLAQEAFVAAWRDLDRLRDVDRVGSWVAGIARNLASSAARDRARRQIDPPALADVPTPETPEDVALEREDRELLHRALADVPEAHREALVLYYLEGESVAAIAAALGIREDLVKQRLSRGRRALRDGVAARVESALTRARPRPALRLGVLAALTSLGTREAAATTGKALAVMSAKKMTLAAVVALAIGGGAIWLGTRASAHDEPASTSPTPAPTPKPGPPAASPATAPRPPSVRRLDSPAARTALLEAIRQRAQHKQDQAAAASRTGAPSQPPAAPTPRPTLPDGDAAKQYIRAAVKAIVPQLLECYEDGLTRNPRIGGTIVVDFTIEGEPEVGGVVGQSAIDPESTLIDPTVRECIQETMYALEIDPPESGGVVRVHYPFVFSATGDPDAPPAR